MRASLRAFLLLIIFVGRSALAEDVTLSWNPNSEGDLAGYKVYYGPSSGDYTTITDVGLVTTYTINNLGAGTYYFVVTAYNTSGVESTFSNEIFKTMGSTAPVISSVSATGITTDSAAIAWATDIPCNSQVEYGITSGYGSLSTPDSSMVTAHLQNLAGLQPTTIYNYRVRSSDSAGRLAVSSNFTFTTAQICSYSLSPGGQAVNAGPDSGSVTVAAPGNCSWTASSDATWITITSGSAGTGSGTVNYTVAANTTSGSRSGSLSIAGQTFTVTQAKAGCDVTLDGAIDPLDIQALLSVILGTAKCPGNCDVNRDGKVDVVDLQVLQNVILGVRTCP